MSRCGASAPSRGSTGTRADRPFVTARAGPPEFVEELSLGHEWAEPRRIEVGPPVEGRNLPFASQFALGDSKHTSTGRESLGLDVGSLTCGGRGRQLAAALVTRREGRRTPAGVAHAACHGGKFLVHITHEINRRRFADARQ
jgi:hypothetical protein